MVNNLNQTDWAQEKSLVWVSESNSDPDSKIYFAQDHTSDKLFNLSRLASSVKWDLIYLLGLQRILNKKICKCYTSCSSSSLSANLFLFTALHASVVVKTKTFKNTCKNNKIIISRRQNIKQSITLRSTQAWLTDLQEHWEYLLEMQIPYPETGSRLGMGPRNLHFNKHSGAPGASRPAESTGPNGQRKKKKTKNLLTLSKSSTSWGTEWGPQNKAQYQLSHRKDWGL